MHNSLLVECEGYKWAMEPARLKAFVEHVGSLAVSENVMQISVAARAREIRIEGATAVVPITGVLLKTVPNWVRFWGIEATGYDEIGGMIAAAMSNKAIGEIHLQIDSPGGQVDGLVEAADAIFTARDEKTVTATIEDLGASAAYWLASQASEITAGRNTEVGSIGVYTVYVDGSKAASERGFKVIVIRSGEHKGMGVPGDEISEQQIAAVQEVVDAMNENFIGAVAAGRGRDAGEIRDLATGQLWIAGAALELGLIDSISQAPASSAGSAENTAKVRQISTGKGKSSKGETLMDTETNERALDAEKLQTEARESALSAERERVAGLKAEFTDDPGFAIKAVEQGWSLAEAKGEYCDVLKGRLAERDETAAAGAAAAGAEPLAQDGSDDAGGGDFMAEAEQLAEAKQIGITAAMKQLKRSKPALHAAFLGRSEAMGRAAYAEAV
jgi:signal peptide peptidase SppA